MSSRNTIRRAWLAGSLPGDSPTQAMQLALKELGQTLLALPSGEVNRPNWVSSITDELATTPLFTVAKEGGWTGYDDFRRLTPTGSLDKLDLGYYRPTYTEDRPIADQLIRAAGVALSYQVDIASPWDLSMVAMGPMRAQKYYKAFESATVRDIMRIYTEDETVVFQISTPLELIGALSAPGMARSIVTRKMVRKITDFVLQCPPGIRTGVHLCLGDMNHRAKGKLSQLAPLVDFVNELTTTWPRGYPLVYVTLPLAEANVPPVTEPSWYTDLAHLAVPSGVRLVAGICHEKVTTDELRPVVNLMDSLTHQTVAVGASCGLALRGDRSLDDVLTVLRQQRELCEGSPIGGRHHA